MEEKRKTWRNWRTVWPVVGMGAALTLVVMLWTSAQEEMQPTPPQRTVRVQTPVSPSIPTQAVAVQTPITQLASPVENAPDVRVVETFFRSDPQRSEEVAVTHIDDTFRPHLGIDFAHSKGQSFDVRAAERGSVTHIDTSPMWGTSIEINHGSSLRTVYRSVQAPQVVVGAVVTKGQVIAQAGTNGIERGKQAHVHFEVWSDGQPMDPLAWLPQ
ncbi:MAG: M23 family metallopeptidase [Paenibacillaceae bacterium]|jgi:stage II sporulation protein Q|nr:M23 family metallopeptidase [Paenibacillaceae bacterium]